MVTLCGLITAYLQFCAGLMVSGSFPGCLSLHSRRPKSGRTDTELLLHMSVLTCLCVSLCASFCMSVCVSLCFSASFFFLWEGVRSAYARTYSWLCSSRIIPGRPCGMLGVDPEVTTFTVLSTVPHLWPLYMCISLCVCLCVVVCLTEIS